MRVAGIIIAFAAASGIQTPQVVMKPEWGVVLQEDQAKVFWKPQLCSRPAPSPIDSVWIPDEAIIRRLEGTLGPALQEAIDRSPGSREKPRAEDFYRQYVGLVIAGKRTVYINGFHETTVDRVPGRPTPWRTQALTPCDGGLLFFGAEYSVDGGTIARELITQIG